MNTDRTAVIFRVDREGNVFALFPELPADAQGWYCTSFEHIGQHGMAEYYGCMKASRPATPSEFYDLAEELKQRGYNLNIVRRATPAMHDKRRKQPAG